MVATSTGSLYTVATNQRAIFVGKTESGKTYLARHLMADVQRVIVLDPKGTLWIPEWKLVDWTDKGAKALLAGPNREGFRPPARLRVAAPRRGERAWEYYMDVAWEAGDVLVYIDEMYGVCMPGRQPSPELSALYTRGRERGIGTWSATQRPAWVPLFSISEAEWSFVFRLQLAQDRKAIMERTGAPEFEQEIPKSDKYGFRFYNQRWQNARYSKGVI